MSVRIIYFHTQAYAASGEWLYIKFNKVKLNKFNEHLTYFLAPRDAQGYKLSHRFLYTTGKTVVNSHFELKTLMPFYFYVHWGGKVFK